MKASVALPPPNVQVGSGAPLVPESGEPVDDDEDEDDSEDEDPDDELLPHAASKATSAPRCAAERATEVSEVVGLIISTR